MTEQGAYESNLRHIAEPAAPSERDKAVSMTLPDWTALWFADVLRDYAGYEADDPHSGIAVGLASYIDKKVRDEGQSYVNLYVHTEAAVRTLVLAGDYAAGDEPNSPMVQVHDAVGAVELAFTDQEPEVVELDGEEVIVYDEDEARESLAEKKMAEAESEYLAKVEEEAEKRGVNNRKTPRVNPRYRE